MFFNTTTLRQVHLTNFNHLMKNIIYIGLFLGITAISSCKKEKHLVKIEGTRVEINDSISGNIEIENFIKPYRESVNKNLDSVLAYAPETYTKGDGKLNTAIGNLMADIVLEQANPVFKSRTGNTISMVLLNYGGIRAPISKGKVTSRTAYQVMPFENSIIVAEMKGSHIKNLIEYLQKAQKAHPISGLKLSVDANFDVIKALINGKEIEDEETYFVATNDYLFNGGSQMYFFEQSTNSYILNYKIRNAMIDYFKKVDTISPVIDDRFVQIN